MHKYLLLLFLPAAFTAAAQHSDIVCKTLSIAGNEMRNARSRNMTAESNSSDNFDVKFYRCEWTIDPSVYFISGKVSSHFIITRATNNIIYDLHNQLNVDSVVYHQQKIGFSRPGNHTISINFPSVINKNTLDSVSIYYKGVPGNSGFGSFITTTHNSTPILWSLSEPYGGKDWWPCRNGLDDKADSVDIIIGNPQQYKASSNGVLISEVVNGNTRTSYYQHRYPIATYLVGMAVTNYIVFNETINLSSRTVPLITHAYPESETQFRQNSHFTIENMQLYDQLIGDYPFERYGNTQWNWGGGMEHQTNSFVFLSEDVLCAHELAHQWFGDKITCASWKDIWLNEGFATYFSYLQFEKNNPAFYHNNVLAVMNDHITVVPGGSVIVDDTSNVGRIFDGRLSYEKGSYVLRMLRGVLGDSVFFRGLRNYLGNAKLAYNYASTADLQKSLEQTSGISLQEFFNDWVYGQGFPTYHLQFSNKGNGWTRVVLNQSSSHPSVSFFEMPVELTFVKGSQNKTVRIDHRYNNQAYWVDLGFDADTVLIDPNLWIISRNNTVQKNNYNFGDYSISVYPNPFIDQLSIRIVNPPASDYSLRLYNSLGQLVWSSDHHSSVREEIIPVPAQSFPAGMYLLKLTEGNLEKKTLKLIKQK